LAFRQLAIYTHFGFFSEKRDSEKWHGQANHDVPVWACRVATPLAIRAARGRGLLGGRFPGLSPGQGYGELGVSRRDEELSYDNETIPLGLQGRKPGKNGIMNVGTTTIVLALAVTAGAGAALMKYGPSATSKSFTDCRDCPQMIVVPAGEFTMGSPANELYRGAEAQHRVTIPKPFALGIYEVTFNEWDACAADGACGGYRPDDHGWGRGKHPVVDVSWNDAKKYIAWLSKKTGKKYRLPSEAEWEYAARAGAGTPFAFGATISSEQANYDGTTAYGAGPTGVNRQKTMPVGSFPANAFGLHDMHGNVWEWMEDCWSDEYGPKTPANGAPYGDGNCDGHVMRGGSWEDYPGDVRAAARVGGDTDDQSWGDGFRVAREME
jgi:formylglycine-generating enzyme required for sulfatase activity